VILFEFPAWVHKARRALSFVPLVAMAVLLVLCLVFPGFGMNVIMVAGVVCLTYATIFALDMVYKYKPLEVEVDG